MTRLITDGAEMGDMLFWDYKNSGSIVAVSVSTYGGSGSYASTIPIHSGHVYKNISPISECYFRIRIRGDPFVRGDGTEAKHIGFYKDNTALAWFGPNSSFQECLYVNGSVVATATPVLSSSTWYCFEGFFKLHDTSGSGILKTNGITQIQYSGDTKPGSDTTFNRIRIESAFSHAASVLLCFDDLALNDTSGSIDNSWCGSARIERLVVNANGDVNEWTPSSGSHWQCVDEAIPNGDTDYITINVPNKYSMFNLAPYTDTNKTVARIWAEARAQDYSVLASKIKIGIKTSGSIFMGQEKELPSEYVGVSSDEFIVDPTSGNTWTKTELDSLQVVVESL